MIILTKFGGKEFMVNEELIETVNETPDTVVLMNNGHTYIVMEPMDEIMTKIVEFRRGARRRISDITSE